MVRPAGVTVHIRRLVETMYLAWPMEHESRLIALLKQAYHFIIYGQSSPLGQAIRYRIKLSSCLQ